VVREYLERELRALFPRFWVTRVSLLLGHFAILLSSGLVEGIKARDYARSSFSQWMLSRSRT